MNPMTITYSDFLGTVTENEGKKLRTIGGNTDFYAFKSRTGVRLVIGKGTEPVINAAKIQEYLDIYNRDNSVHTPDYNANLRHSVYVLGIIKLWEQGVLQKVQMEKVMAETADMDLNRDLDEAEEFSRPEGAWRVRLHVYRERSLELVRQAKEAFRVKHDGLLFCEVCRFDFGKTYDEPDFIEAHHRMPLRDVKAGVKTKISDLAMVCANCHRMLHRGNPWPTVEGLKQRIKERAGAHF